MSTVTTEINYYLRIAIDINKKVGGKRGYEAEAGSQDVFAIQKENLNKDMKYVYDLINSREGKTGAQLLNINMEVKEKFEEIFDSINRMKEAINIEKDSNENKKEIKLQVVEKMREKAKKLEEMMEMSGDLDSLLAGARKNNTNTNTMPLLDKGGADINSYRIKNNNKRNGPSEMELEAMNRWKKNDEMMDEKLDELTDMTIEWKKKVKETGQLIDESDKKIDDLTNEVDKVNDNLLRSNKQLKGIIEKYSKPHKFCIDIVLVLLLIGMIVGIVQMAPKAKSS